MSATPAFSVWKLLRTLAGLVLAPVAGGTIVMTGLASVDAFTQGRVQDLASSAVFGAIYGGMLGAIPALVIGWPLHLLLLKLRWTSVWVYMALGAVIGLGGIYVSAGLLEAFD